MTEQVFKTGPAPSDDQLEALLCSYCARKPEEIDEYLPGTEEQFEDGERAWLEGDFRSPAEYVWYEEGTLDRDHGGFACTDCYMKLGCPGSPSGWKAKPPPRPLDG